MTHTLNIADAVSFLTEQAKKNGADAAESFGVDSLAIETSCRLQKTETIEHSQSSGVDLRVFCGKKQAVVSSSVLNTETLSTLAENAVQMAKALPDDAFCGLANPEIQATNLPDLDLFDEAEYSTQELLDLALKTEQAALDVSGVTSSDGAGASIEKSHIIMSSTTGFSRQYKRSKSSLMTSVIAEDCNKNKETDYDYSTAVYLSDLENPEIIGKNAGERTVKKLGNIKIDSATMDVVFEPRLAREFIATVASAINGAIIAKQASFFKDAMNTQILPEALSIIENPHKKRGLASRPCDSEGLPTKQLALVDNGVLTSWLLDLRCARQLGLKPTGHGVRGLGSMPRPAPSNLTLVGGQVSEKELLSDIKKGVYITQMFGDGVNLITGDYSRGAAGFLIENGELTKPVAEITIAGNLKDMFKTMVAANNTTEKYSINAPSLRFFGLAVAGK